MEIECCWNDEDNELVADQGGGKSGDQWGGNVPDRLESRLQAKMPAPQMQRASRANRPSRPRLVSASRNMLCGDSW